MIIVDVVFNMRQEPILNNLPPSPRLAGGGLSRESCQHRRTLIFISVFYACDMSFSVGTARR